MDRLYAYVNLSPSHISDELEEEECGEDTYTLMKTLQPIFNQCDNDDIKTTISDDLPFNSKQMRKYQASSITEIDNFQDGHHPLKFVKPMNPINEGDYETGTFNSD